MMPTRTERNRKHGQGALALDSLKRFLKRVIPTLLHPGSLAINRLLKLTNGKFAVRG
jgi:hypothetical protein